MHPELKQNTRRDQKGRDENGALVYKLLVDVKVRREREGAVRW